MKAVKGCPPTKWRPPSNKFGLIMCITTSNTREESQERNRDKK